MSTPETVARDGRRPQSIMVYLVSITWAVCLVSLSQAVDTNDTCWSEMLLVTEYEKEQVGNNTNRWLHLIHLRQKVVREWDKKQGTGASVTQVVGAMQYLSNQSSNRCSSIEIRWSDGNRAIVAEVIEGTGGAREISWYLFKYKDAWHTLWRRDLLLD